MGFNTVIPTSILMEIFMLASELSVFQFETCPQSVTHQHPESVQIAAISFTLVVATSLALSVFWIIYLRRHDYEYTRNIRLLRGFQGISLVFVGIILVKTAQEIKGDGQNECCSLFGIHIIAGATAIMDGCFYLLHPTKKSASLFSVMGPISFYQTDCEHTNQRLTKEMEAQLDLPPYEAPPSYNDVQLEAHQQLKPTTKYVTFTEIH